MKAMTIPTKPSTDPTERSIWRATITRTMPPTMTPTTLDWTIKFQRLRGVRNVRSVRKWKPTQMMASAASIPTRRTSTPVRTAKRWKTLIRLNGGGASAGASRGTVVSRDTISPVKLKCRREPEARPAAPRSISGASLAGWGGFGRIDPLTNLSLGRPLGLDHEIQVVEGDGHRLEQN